VRWSLLQRVAMLLWHLDHSLLYDLKVRILYSTLQFDKTCAACCIWSVISPFSNLNQWSSSLSPLYFVPFKRDQGDWESRLRFKDTLNSTGCKFLFNLKNCILFSIRNLYSSLQIWDLWIHSFLYIPRPQSGILSSFTQCEIENLECVWQNHVETNNDCSNLE